MATAIFRRAEKKQGGTRAPTDHPTPILHHDDTIAATSHDTSRVDNESKTSYLAQCVKSQNECRY